MKWGCIVLKKVFKKILLLILSCLLLTTNLVFSASESMFSDIGDVILDITNMAAEDTPSGTAPQPITYSWADLDPEYNGEFKILRVDRVLKGHIDFLKAYYKFKESLTTSKAKEASFVELVLELKNTDSIIGNINKMVYSIKAQPSDQLPSEILKNLTKLKEIINSIKSNYFHPLKGSFDAFSKSNTTANYIFDAQGYYDKENKKSMIHEGNKLLQTAIEDYLGWLSVNLNSRIKKLDDTLNMIDAMEKRIISKEYETIHAINCSFDESDILLDDIMTFTELEGDNLTSSIKETISSCKTNSIEDIIETFYMIFYERKRYYNKVGFGDLNTEYSDDLTTHTLKTLQVLYSVYGDSGLYYKNLCGFNGGLYNLDYYRVVCTPVDSVKSISLTNQDEGFLSKYIIDEKYEQANSSISQYSVEKIGKRTHILINNRALQAKLPLASYEQKTINFDLYGLINPAEPPDFGAAPIRAKLLVKALSGGIEVSSQYNISLIPAINESWEVHGQCTWFSALMRFKDQNPHLSYGEGRPLSGNPADYNFPKAGDMITNPTEKEKHAAYIANVDLVSSDSAYNFIINKYKITIFQANVSFRDGTLEVKDMEMTVRHNLSDDTYIITRYPRYCDNVSLYFKNTARETAQSKRKTFKESIIRCVNSGKSFVDTRDFINTALSENGGHGFLPFIPSFDTLYKDATKFRQFSFDVKFNEYVKQNDTNLTSKKPDVKLTAQNELIWFKALAVKFADTYFPQNNLNTQKMLHNFRIAVKSSESYNAVSKEIEDLLTKYSDLEKTQQVTPFNNKFKSIKKFIYENTCANIISNYNKTQWIDGDDPDYLDLLFFDLPVSLGYETIDGNIRQMLEFDGIPDIVGMYSKYDTATKDVYFYIVKSSIEGRFNPFISPIAEDGKLLEIKADISSLQCIRSHKKISAIQ